VRRILKALIMSAIGAAGATIVGMPDTRAAAQVPIIVELFTSEGCSSCPPADVLLDKLIAGDAAGSLRAAGAEIIGLGEHVDYWDQLGWKDRFSSAALTDRQRAYQTYFNTDSIYTPQMVVDGRAELVGSDAGAARRAIERSLALPHGVVKITLDQNASQTVALQVEASNLPRASRGDRADIVVAVTEDRLRSDVKRGENHGKTLVHAAVVRYMATIGQAAAEGPASAHAEIPLAADWQRANVRIVAFVQEQRSRAILASAAASLNVHP
jgi:hypothetical protein